MRITREEADEMTDRMYEACDIARGIESGQFKALDDVLDYARLRSAAIECAMEDAGVPMIRSVSMIEFEQCERDVDQLRRWPLSMPAVAKN
jgi:hypothetical protein